MWIQFWGGVGELRGLSQWVQLYTGAQINVGNLCNSIFNLWYSPSSHIDAMCNVPPKNFCVAINAASSGFSGFLDVPSSRSLKSFLVVPAFQLFWILFRLKNICRRCRRSIPNVATLPTTPNNSHSTPLNMTFGSYHFQTDPSQGILYH